MPALRERKKDIPDLALHLLQKVVEDNGDEVKTSSPEAMELLCGADFPGNARQLETMDARAAAMSETAVIGIEDLEELTPASHPVTASTMVTSNTDEPVGSLNAATSLSAIAGDQLAKWILSSVRFRKKP